MVEAGEIRETFSASEVGPVFVLEYTPSIVAGLILAALLAAIMSTSDSFPQHRRGGRLGTSRVRWAARSSGTRRSSESRRPPSPV